MLITNYRIYNNIYDSEYMSPNTFSILASNDRINWVEIDSQSGQIWDTTNNYNYKQYDVYTTLLYKYFAIVVSKVGNDGIYEHRDALKIQSLVFYGVEFNKYGVNYDTGLYVNGAMKVIGDMEVDGDMTFGEMIVEKMGIGVTSPVNGLIEISGSNINNAVTTTGASYLRSTYTEVDNVGSYSGSFIGVSSGPSTQSYSIYADGKIAALEFNAVSDLRVKNIINERNIDDDIQIIKKLNTYDYNYIDKINDGHKEKIGFIAQEIKTINKNFTNQSKRFIPNIFKKFHLKNKNIIIINKKLKLSENDLIKVEVFYNNEPKIIEVNILNIKINEIYINNSLEIDIEKGIFIYGKYVNDFLTIDINQITSVNTNIIKHLLSRVEDLEEYIMRN